jgi:hypothetical protein
MSENIDGAGRRSPSPRLLVRPLLLFAGVALVIGFVASRTDVQPYETPFFRLFFSDPLHMKAWLTTSALLLGLAQLLTAARIYGKLRFPPEGRLYPLVHRWSGRVAILLTLPAAYHCIFELGFGTYNARAFIHSFRQGPHGPHKRLPRLGATRGGRGAVRHSYGFVAHFGVLVVRHPRCQPIKTDCSHETPPGLGHCIRRSRPSDVSTMITTAVNTAAIKFWRDLMGAGRHGDRAYHSSA